MKFKSNFKSTLSNWRQKFDIERPKTAEKLLKSEAISICHALARRGHPPDCMLSGQEAVLKYKTRTHLFLKRSIRVHASESKEGISLQAAPTGLNTGKEEISRWLPFLYGPGRPRSLNCHSNRSSDHKCRRQHATMPGRQKRSTLTAAFDSFPKWKCKK